MANVIPPQLPEDEVPEDFSEFLRSMGSSAKNYVERERRYLELLVSDRIGRIGGRVVVVVLVLMLLNWALLLAFIAGAKAYARCLGDEVHGYLAMAGTLLAVVLLFLLCSRRVGRWVKMKLVDLLHGHG